MLQRTIFCTALTLVGCSSGLESTGFGDVGASDAGSDLPTVRTDTAIRGPDGDGDGLPDQWEAAAGDPSQLDPTNADTDGDGVSDADEDLDGDQLDNATELAIAAWPIASNNAPHPLRRDLLVELDEMVGKSLSSTVLADAAAIYAELPEPVGLIVLRDETDIAATQFDGSFEQRHAFLESHGPTFQTSPSPLPTEQMVHVAVVTRRLDEEFRGGEVVTHGDGDPEKTGVLIFYDALDELHPQCGLDGDPPDITLDEALASALAHELGHVLQLGHETEVGGGVNYFNIMSVPTTCNEAQQRFHGEGNADAALGATDGSGSRFSDEAAALMRFGERLSVDTATLVNEGVGLEM